MHHRGAVVWAQRSGLPDLEEEFKEGGGRFWDTKVWPCGVVKMEDLPGFPRLFKTKHHTGTLTGELGRLGSLHLKQTEITDVAINVAPTTQDRTGQDRFRQSVVKV